MTDRALNLVQRIVAAHLVGDYDDALQPGAFVRLRPERVMSHDNTSAIMSKFEGLFHGSERPASIADPTQPVIAIDHDIQNHAPENLGKYARIRSFASRHGLVFHPAGTGIGHQLMLDRGHVLPGSLCVASDSHANAYGALGALGAPIVRTDAAAVWATGEFWWCMPPVLRVELTGALRSGVSGKDVIIALCGRFRREALNSAVEFGGPGIAALPVADRIAIANMTTEWGASACVMEADGAVLDHLLGRAAAGAVDCPVPSRDELAARVLRAELGAEYCAEIRLDLSTVSECVTGPNTVSRAVSVTDLARERIRVDKAYLLSCVNGRVDDFRIAAEIMRGRRVAPHVELYVAAASAEVQRRATEKGYWSALLDAGAIELPPGCGPCIGLGRGTVGAGETAISSTNRNYPGRMGHRDGQVYLSSPTVVAASALAGFITGPESAGPPTRLVATSAPGRSRTACSRESDAVASAGECVMTARSILIPEDDLSTDQVFAGKWTYAEGLTPAQLASAAFENLDAALAPELRAGDVVLAGENFGTGSSREQAATALIAAGVVMIACVSVSATFQRNAINNGLLCVECPDLKEWLDEFKGRGGPGRIGPVVEIDVCVGRMTIGAHEMRFAPARAFVAELLGAGGLEAWTRRRLMSAASTSGAHA